MIKAVDDEMKIFAGRACPELAKQICDYLGMALGKAEVGRFPDGELNVKLDEDVRGRDVFLVQSTCPPVNENLMELLLMVDSARRASASSITAVIPYYGYARKDRKDEGRVPIAAKLVANMLTVAGTDRVLALDLHATQIQGFFDIPVDHLYSFPVIVEYLREKAIEDLVLVAPDIGRVRMANAYSRALGAPLAMVEKRRESPDSAKVGFVIGDVRDKNVLLVDDIIATGGTIAIAAHTLKEAGARQISVAAVHPVFCGPVAERLLAAPIDEVVVTDTIPLNDLARSMGEKIKVLSVGRLLGEAMRRIHCNESVSLLFDQFNRE